MKQNDEIKELFSQKLANHEAPVNPELWNTIASKIASPPLAGKTATVKVVSMGLKTIISIITVASIGVSTLYLLTIEKEKQVSKSPKNQVINVPKTSYLTEETTTDTKQTLVTKTLNNNSSLGNKEANKNELLESSNFSFIENIKNETSNESSAKTVIELEKENTIITQTTEGNSTNSNKEQQQTTLNTVSSSIETSEQEIKLPNIVTPNNDGENDLFWINAKSLQDFSITILNDKNKVVFSSSDPDFKWDGKDQLSNLVPVGAYIYFFTAKDENGKLVSKSNKLEVKY